MKWITYNMRLKFVCLFLYFFFKAASEEYCVHEENKLVSVNQEYYVGPYQLGLSQLPASRLFENKTAIRGKKKITMPFLSNAETELL